MATDPEALKYWLDKPARKQPSWKTVSHSKIHELIERYTGRMFKKTKGPPLYDHQFRSLGMALCYKQSLLFLGMRTGKTRIVLEFAEHLRKANMWKGRGLIIVPSPTVLDVWEEQIDEYTNLAYHIIRSTSDKDVLAGIEGNHQLTVVSWSVLQQVLSRKMPVIKYKKVVLGPNGKPLNKMQLDIEFAKEFGDCFSMSTIDEIQACKSRTSLAFHIAAAVTSEHEFRMGLTGTPFGRHPLDIWPEAFLIDRGRTFTNNYYFFQEAFAKKKKSVWGGGFEYSFDEDKLPILAAKLGGVSIAYKLEELREINEKPIKTFLRPTKIQATKYADILNDHVTAIIKASDDLDSQKNRNLFARLRRISSGHISFVDDYGELQVETLPSHAKLIWLRNAINEGLGETPFVFFYEFNHSGQEIMDELKRAKIKVARVWGGNKENGKAVKNFQNGKVMGLVLQSKSGNAGIDLWPADYMCFYESPTSPIIRAQAEKRPFGPKRGARPVIIEDLITFKVEERVYGFIKEGKELLDKTIHRPKDLLSILL